MVLHVASPQRLVLGAGPYGHQGAFTDVAKVTKRSTEGVGRAARVEAPFGADPCLSSKERTLALGGDVAGSVGVDGMDVLQ